MLGYISRLGWVDRVLEGKTRHSTRRNRFEMAGIRRRPLGRRVGRRSVRIQSVWPGGSGLRICWTPLPMALKSANDCGVDDEISSTKIDNLAKNFRNFQRNNNKRERNRNNTDSKNVKKNETTKNTISEKTKDKVVQSSNSSL